MITKKGLACRSYISPVALVFMFIGLAFAPVSTLAETSSEKASRIVDAYDKSTLAELPFFQGCSDLLLQKSDYRPLDSAAIHPIVTEFIDYAQARVIGQNEAIEAMASALTMILAQLNDPDRPMGRILAIGPTGVGKTELVKVLVKFLGGDKDRHLLRVNGGELQEDHQLSKLLGTTAGLIGFDTVPLFHQENINGILLKFKLASGEETDIFIKLYDELEKMGPAASRMMLNELDEGKVSLGDNSTSNSRNGIIFATSNAGADKIGELYEQREAWVKEQEDAGVELTDEQKDPTGRIDLKLRAEMRAAIEAALAERFAPEFIARWPDIIHFLHHRREEFQSISQIFIALLQRRIFERSHVKFGIYVPPKVREWLIEHNTDYKKGARSLQFAIEKKFGLSLARFIAASDQSDPEAMIKDGEVIVVQLDGEGPDAELNWSVQTKPLTREQLLEFADSTYPNLGLGKIDFDATPDDDKWLDPNTIIAAFSTQLNENADLARYVFDISEDSEHNRVGYRQANEAVSSARVTEHKWLKIIKVGERYLKLETNMDSLGPEAKIKSQSFTVIPETLVALYGEGKVHKYPNDEFEALLEAGIPENYTPTQYSTSGASVSRVTGGFMNPSGGGAYDPAAGLSEVIGQLRDRGQRTGGISQEEIDLADEAQRLRDAMNRTGLGLLPEGLGLGDVAGSVPGAPEALSAVDQAVKDFEAEKGRSPSGAEFDALIRSVF
ncbi:MAG: AAA family ATPase [Pseudomonadota bacterium]